MKNSNVFPSYTFTRRVTHDNLIKNFVNKLKKLQTSFKTSFEELFTGVRLNIQTCDRLDLVLGADSIDEEESETLDDISILKDGSHKLKCPIQHCISSTFKLKRHLKDVHKIETTEQLDLATQISQKMERNKGVYCVYTYIDFE